MRIFKSKKSTFLFLIALIVLLGTSLFDRSPIKPIEVYGDITMLRILIAVIGIVVAFIFPGFLLSSLLGLKRLGLTFYFVFSLAICGIVGIVFYNFNILQLIPIFYIFTSLATLYVCIKNPIELKIDRQNLGILLVVLSIVVGGFVVQMSARYLAGGDQWRNARIAIYLLSDENALQKFRDPYAVGLYPIFIGYIITNLAVLSNLPVVNAYALFFFINGLSALVFFKIAEWWLKDRNAAVIAAFLYSIGGGFGWILALTSGISPYSWEMFAVSHKTQDIYFASNLAGIIRHTAYQIANLFIMSSIYLSLCSVDSEQKEGLILSALSGFLAAVAFLTHMVDFLLLPLIVFIYGFSKKGKNLLVALAACVASLLGFDALSNFYTLNVAWQRFIIYIGVGKSYSSILLGLSSGMIVLFLILYRKRKFDLNRHIEFGRNVSLFLFIFFMLMWIILFFQWSVSEVPADIYYVLHGYPPYIFPVRFGIILPLFVVGLLIPSKNKKAFALGLVWLLFGLILTFFFWGQWASGMVLMPILAIFSAQALRTLSKLKFKVLTRLGQKRLTGIPVKVMIPLILLLSSGSYIYLIAYTISAPGITDDVASATAWIYEQVPDNETILVPALYLNDFVSSISLKNTLPRAEPAQDWEEAQTDARVIFTSTSGSEVCSLLHKWRVRYAMLTNPIDTFGDTYIRHLFSISDETFLRGNVAILKLPEWNDPLLYKDIYIDSKIDRETSFGIFDAFCLKRHMVLDWFNISIPLNLWKRTYEQLSEVTVTQNSLGTLIVDPPDNRSHWYGTILELNQSVSEYHFLAIKYEISRKPYNIGFAFYDEVGKTVGGEYLRNVCLETPITEIFSVSKESVHRIELLIWTTECETYEWTIISISFFNT